MTDTTTEVLQIVDKWMDCYDHVGTGSSATGRIGEREWAEDRARIVTLLAAPEAVAEVYMEQWYETAPGCTGEREAVNVRFLRNALYPPVGTKLYAAPIAGQQEVTEDMVERGAALSTSGRKDNPKYRAKIRAILEAALQAK